MVFRVSITILMLIVTATIYSIMSNNKPALQLTVKGNDDLGIKLELPYPNDSPGDVIITNIGNHNPIAYKIRWEAIKYTGETVERQSIKCHILAILEKNPDKRADLLQREPLLASKSRWLIGLGRETMKISNQVPSLAFIGGRPPQVFPDLSEYKQISVTLEDIMLEDGQITGRDAAAFDKEIQTLVSKYLERLNKEHTNGPSKQ